MYVMLCMLLGDLDLDLDLNKENLGLGFRVDLNSSFVISTWLRLEHRELTQAIFSLLVFRKTKHCYVMN